MKKFKDINKQRLVLCAILLTDKSNRFIGKTLNVSHNTVKRYREIFNSNELTITDLDTMDDTDIEKILHSKKGLIESKNLPDWNYINRSMQEKHMTLQLLWEEYRLANPGHAYGYSQFTVLYKRYLGKLDITMRQSHRAGECVYVDFAGSTLSYEDINTSVSHNVQIFVGVLGCSNYTFACAVQSQSTSNWIEAHNKMYHYFGGVPQILKPDNLKAAVIRPGREPILNRSYLEQSKHYRIIIVPARVRRPQDKSKAELGVLLVSRWILPLLRRRKFFSIEEINKAISELLTKLNERPFQKLPGCRRSRFEEMDKPLLRPLPSEPFEYAEWITAKKVGKDYHLNILDHFYSVPHELVGERVETRVTNKMIEFMYRGRRVASHLRSFVESGHTTSSAHQPKAHRHYSNLTPEKIIDWAKQIGEASTAAVEYQFYKKPHTILGLRACSTLKKLAKDYGEEKFEAACHRAKLIGSLSVKSIQSILQRRIADFPFDDKPIQMNLPLHENIRGSMYYSNGGK